MWHLVSSKMHKNVNVCMESDCSFVFYCLWSANTQIFLSFFFELTWQLGGSSGCGACWADFTCWMSHVMICNLSFQPCDRPFSLVSEKHSRMFKIGQFHSVVRLWRYMGPLSLRFMALWTLCALTRAQRLQLEGKNGFVFLTLSAVPGCPYPPETLSKMSAPSLRRNKSGKWCCII